jgi:alkane 1-monooxygenase
MLAFFTLAAGWTGALVYAAVSIMVAFSMQLVTYLQHWGLGDDNLPDARRGDYAWESDCRFQAWVTMGLSLHQSHHHDGSQPYYRAALSADSPRSPAGYVLLMFASLVPPLWWRVMAPALSYWRAQPTKPLSSGRRLACVGFYR